MPPPTNPNPDKAASDGLQPRPEGASAGLERAFELIAALPPEIDRRDDTPPQDREGL